jgi:hypothetical protein
MSLPAFKELYASRPRRYSKRLLKGIHWSKQLHDLQRGPNERKGVLRMQQDYLLFVRAQDDIRKWPQGAQ